MEIREFFTSIYRSNVFFFHLFSIFLFLSSYSSCENLNHPEITFTLSLSYFDFNDFFYFQCFLFITFLFRFHVSTKFIFVFKSFNFQQFNYFSSLLPLSIPCLFFFSVLLLFSHFRGSLGSNPCCNNQM